MNTLMALFLMQLNVEDYTWFNQLGTNVDSAIWLNYKRSMKNMPYAFGQSDNRYVGLVSSDIYWKESTNNKARSKRLLSSDEQVNVAA